MSTDHFRYDLLTRDALRGVLRHVLTETATKGLAGDHHFYITFLTQTPGVKLSPRLAAQYPEEMTIILQHQFWDLLVSPELFEVGLSFNGIPERLVVPFAAIKSFFDPSVQFGLQFEVGDDAASDGDKKDDASTQKPEATRTEPSTPAANAKSNVKAGKPGSKAKAAPRDDESDGDEPDDRGPGDSPPRQGGAEVVRLDRFRKK